MSSKRKTAGQEGSQAAKRQKNLFGDAMIGDKKFVISAAAPECTPLRLVAEAFQKFVGEANIDMTPDGLRMTAMDVSNISMIKLDIPKEWFAEGFRCDYAVALGINFTGMHQIFSKRKSDGVAIQVPTNTSEVLFSFRRPGQRALASYKLKLLDIDSEMLCAPENIPYQTVIRMPTKLLATIMSQNIDFGDDLTIYVTENRIKFKTKGDTTTAVRTLFDGDSGVEFQKVVPYNQSYPLKYLHLFSKAMEVAETVELRMAAEGDDMPLCVYCPFPGGVGSLIYYLSPRSTSDDIVDSDDDQDE